MCRISGAPRDAAKQRISWDKDSDIEEMMGNIVSMENGFHIPMRHTTLHPHVCSVPLHISYRAIGPRNEQHSPLEGLNQPVCLALNLKDLYCFIGRACRQSAAIVIQTGIVLNSRASVSPTKSHTQNTTQHPSNTTQGSALLSRTIISSCPELEMT